MFNTIAQTIYDSVASIALPPLPQVLVKFLMLSEDEHVSFTDLASLISLDPAFTAQVLSVASSPAYRLKTPEINLEQSLSVLGLPLLRAMASCLAVQNVKQQPHYERNIDYSGYWRHSLHVAYLAKSLANAVGYQNVEEAYLAGLLHDIGQLLLVGGAIECCDAFSVSNGSEVGSGGLTHILNSIDHVSLGASLVDSWHLSSFMADAILFHQFPAEQLRSADILCRIVWTAHCLGDSDVDLDFTSDLPPGVSEVPALLCIDQAEIVRLCKFSRRWTADHVSSFNLQTHLTAKQNSDHRFVFPYLSLPKREAIRDATQMQLDGLIINQSVLQPLQQRLLTLTDEADIYATLGETARLLFGLGRPVFLVSMADRPVLAVVACAEKNPLMRRLEIPLAQCSNLPLLALQTQQPTSTFSSNNGTSQSLIDIQLARLLGSKGLLCFPMGDVACQGGVMVFGISAEQFARKQRLFESMTSFARLVTGSLVSFRLLRQREQQAAADLRSQFEQKARKVIHESVNPLGIINNYLNILAEKLGDGVVVQQELGILKEEILRVEKIVRRLNDQTEQPLPVETVNVNGLIEGMLALYGESLFDMRGITIDKQLAFGLPSVRADRDSLKQILLNIWKNSSEAMPDGGSFIVSTCVTVNADGRVEIRLSDSGPGIPPDVKERLFQPLSPDRRPENSGLGLSIVASLVERLGGEIICDSSPDKGTTFTIRLAQMQKELI